MVFNDGNYIKKLMFLIKQKKIGLKKDIYTVKDEHIKGQKIIYMEAKSHCQRKLNLLMFPAIFISCAASVMAAFVEKEIWGSIVLSKINAFNSFLLAIISFLKLDAKSEAHKTSAHQYDKLQSTCEFTSGQILLFTNNKEDTEKIIKERLIHLEKKKIGRAHV